MDMDSAMDRLLLLLLSRHRGFSHAACSSGVMCLVADLCVYVLLRVSTAALCVYLLAGPSCPLPHWGGLLLCCAVLCCGVISFSNIVIWHVQLPRLFQPDA
jgi:hypothetical protein